MNNEEQNDQPPKKRGRPKGSKNRTKAPKLIDQQLPKETFCFCNTTQWTCRICHKPTCDFCSDSPEENSNRVCRNC